MSDRNKAHVQYRIGYDRLVSEHASIYREKSQQRKALPYRISLYRFLLSLNLFALPRNIVHDISNDDENTNFVGTKKPA